MENQAEKVNRKEMRGVGTHLPRNQACVNVPASPTGSPRPPRVFRWPRCWGRVGGSGFTHGRANLQARSAFSLISHGVQCSQKSHLLFSSDQPPSDVLDYLLPLWSWAWTAKDPCHLSFTLSGRNPETFRPIKGVLRGHCYF